MKRCPKCHLSYSDDTLEFCLEDGARLLPAAGAVAVGYEAETPTVTVPNRVKQETDKTLNLPFSNTPAAGNAEFQAEKHFGAQPQSADALKEKISGQSRQVLELAPIVISLAHNWWQWVYLSGQYYSSFSSYILSANFLMWLLLLGAGTAVSLVALKRCRNKGFAVASLVILAVNLLLILVPRR